MAIDVTVTEQCDRCKRKEQIVISSDKLEEFEAKQQKAVAVRENVEQFVQENDLPDLVVIFKGEVKMLSNVCDAHCAKPVKNNVETLFREHKERKPRSKKNGKSAEGSEDKENVKDAVQEPYGVVEAAPPEAKKGNGGKGKGKGAASKSA